MAGGISLSAQWGSEAGAVGPSGWTVICHCCRAGDWGWSVFLSQWRFSAPVTLTQPHTGHRWEDAAALLCGERGLRHSGRPHRRGRKPQRPGLSLSLSISTPPSLSLSLCLCLCLPLPPPLYGEIYPHPPTRRARQGMRVREDERNREKTRGTRDIRVDGDESGERFAGKAKPPTEPLLAMAILLPTAPEPLAERISYIDPWISQRGRLPFCCIGQAHPNSILHSRNGFRQLRIMPTHPPPL